MNDDNLKTAAFVFQDEIDQWKLVEHRFDNVQAVRSCGSIVKHNSKDEARNMVKRQAVKALLRYYHEVEAGLENPY